MQVLPTPAAQALVVAAAAATTLLVLEVLVLKAATRCGLLAAPQDLPAVQAATVAQRVLGKPVAVAVKPWPLLLRAQVMVKLLAVGSATAQLPEAHPRLALCRCW